MSRRIDYELIAVQEDQQFITVYCESIERAIEIARSMEAYVSCSSVDPFIRWNRCPLSKGDILRKADSSFTFSSQSGLEASAEALYAKVATLLKETGACFVWIEILEEAT